MYLEINSEKNSEKCTWKKLVKKNSEKKCNWKSNRKEPMKKRVYWKNAMNKSCKTESDEIWVPNHNQILPIADGGKGWQLAQWLLQKVANSGSVRLCRWLEI